MIRLGLIGFGISRSRAPELHETAGRLVGVPVRYELRETRPGEFASALAACRADGLCGVNVTHPFKLDAAHAADTAEPSVRRLLAANTLSFADSGISAFNTDHSGFVRAFQRRFGQSLLAEARLGRDSPGDVVVVGAGGVGQAVAFGLAELGATRLRIHDQRPDAALSLVTRLRAQFRSIRCEAVDGSVDAMRRADGVANCTPMGMHGHGDGMPVGSQVLADAKWAFDAVYTPANTPFLNAAAKRGLACLSGVELWFYQGIHAFERFTGCVIEDETALRTALL